MSSNHIQLKTESILKVPLGSYSNDFLFIVNGEEFRTSRIIADLLSSKINQIHLVDSTIDTFTINTNNSGDFTHILQLVQFNVVNLTDDELPFFLEVIETLQTDFIEYKNDKEPIELTIDNALTQLKKHNKFNKIYRSDIEREISFVSSHFSEIDNKFHDELIKIEENTLNSILGHINLRLSDEDELLQFCIEIYKSDRKFFNVFEFVKFENVSSNKMKEFIEIYNIEDLTAGVWQELSERLKSEIKKERNNNEVNNRYINNKIVFSDKNTFSGIIDHLMKKSSGKIENELNITASSISNSQFQPQNVILFEDQSKFFCSNSDHPSWICFDFKDHQVIVTSYTIRTSVNGYANGNQPKTWLIEGSNDQNSWEILDEENNCNLLQGKDKSRTHTFQIKKNNDRKYRYIRMKQTENWANYNNLFIDSFEIYGEYI